LWLSLRLNKNIMTNNLKSADTPISKAFCSYHRPL
jgi:hypothetical protein